ncbi:hypothetical protein [Youngiibacter fragilis]|uniref:Uncharacterized protein n=1 Tax=Youngiibacter fragilis 232.1 TaxID=994573 RepID=V7I6J3_9CLOT|nr:hypothetical protein [Youngiibacter fragilis]ETA80829.1 hypothetical protein T472_0209650 [Youngiibacter fragilis 232.1]
MGIGQELLNVPFPQMVYQLASAIARSQSLLDRESIEILKVMGNKELAPVFLPAIKIEGGEVVEDEIETSMVGAGFQPTFYQFAETIIEVKMAITMSRETEYASETKGEVKTTSTTSKWWNLSRKTVVTTTPIDASYSSKYNYTQEGSSLIRTRLVPVPPNSIIQRQLDMRSQAMQLMFELDMKKLELALEEKKQALMKEIDEL